MIVLLQSRYVLSRNPTLSTVLISRRNSLGVTRTYAGSGLCPDSTRCVSWSTSQDELDFHSNVQWKLTHTHRGSRVASFLAEDLP